MSERTGARAWRVGALFAAGLLPPVLTRALLMAENDLAPGLVDLRGLASDLAVALVVITLLAAVLRVARPLAMTLAFVWSGLCYGNYEHVTVNGSLAWLAHAEYLTDPTFLRGSVLSPTHPILTAALLVAATACTWLAGAARPRLPLRLRVLAPVALAALAGVAAWPADDEVLTWRQANVVYENLRGLGRPAPEYVGQGTLGPAGRAALEQVFQPDLAGTPRFALGHRGQNVLLVMLEGVSGVHLPSLADRYGIQVSVDMPRLDRLAQENVTWRSFVSHQRQTNRGEYAILCGDLPRLVVDEPKMTAVLMREDPICLPGLLRDAGYDTVYLQSAPLGFMSKDLFMPKIGFARTLGDSWFKRHYVRNRWGIDDRAYLEQALDMVRSLRAGGKPWFLTLLTVGTHHPYLVPADRSGSFAGAAAYLDESFAAFLAGLERMGVLEDTLVLVTSDESVGITGYRGSKRTRDGEGIDDLTKRLSQNWGILIALLPTRQRGLIDEEFMQLDLSLSILDYLGLAEGVEGIAGRSVFRSYASRRPIIFANAYQRILGVREISGNLSICSEDFETCSRYALPTGELFSPRRERIESVPAQEAFLAALVAEDQRRFGRDARKQTLELLSDPIVPVVSGRDMQVIFGGQYFRAAAGTRVDVELSVLLEGKSGRVSVGHLLKSDGKNYHFRRPLPPLEVGDELRLRYSFTLEKDVQYLECLGTAQRLEGEGLRLNFKTARLSLVPVEAQGSRKSSGLEIHEAGLFRPN